ncbi:MAG: transporter substrate-binding domain-containing protein, partial [Candidatus Theseobacter exili]|nr:transporter substrate-binding domain-containing protein [Candidatus Theseobacter exili]
MAVLITFWLTSGLYGQEPLQIVTDPWPPYSFGENEDNPGMDAEIILAVFKQLNIPLTFTFYPWKRCLSMVEKQIADAILDASLTPERKAFLHFPDEPVSEDITVFFIKKDRNIPYTSLKDLELLTAGAILGYSYCDEIDQALFVKNAERVSSLKQNFRKLLAGRIDLIVEAVAVGYYTAKQMGISDQIKIIPNAYYCRGGNYLAFSRKPGHE